MYTILFKGCDRHLQLLDTHFKVMQISIDYVQGHSFWDCQQPNNTHNFAVVIKVVRCELATFDYFLFYIFPYGVLQLNHSLINVECLKSSMFYSQLLNLFEVCAIKRVLQALIANEDSLC